MCSSALHNKVAHFQSRDGLPLHYTTFFKPFRRMLSDNVMPIRDELPNRVKQLSHAFDLRRKACVRQIDRRLRRRN